MKTKPIIAISADVSVTAAAPPAEGEKQGPPSFVANFYNGGALEIGGWEHPVAIDLAGLESGKVLVGNLDHDSSKRVGNFALANDGKSLVANGTASAATPSRDEVVNSARDGYQWQASLEVQPKRDGVEFIKKGAKATANGQEFTGPLYITRAGVLKGFAFVSHGADDSTTASIAATAAAHKEKTMDPKFQVWVEAMGFDASTLTAEQIVGLQANYEGKNTPKQTDIKASSPFEVAKLEAKRREGIREVADKYVARRPGDLAYIEGMEKMHDHAIETNMSVQDFRNELSELEIPNGHTVSAGRLQNRNLSARVLQAALCQTGRLSDVEKQFNDQELQTAHDRFPHGISLCELLILAAEANGHRTQGARVDIAVQRAAFGMNANRQMIHAAGGFSTIDVGNVVAATANKFLHEGWMAVDMTPLRIASVRAVRNFQQITTVSLTGHLQFNKIGADGEIKHGTLDDMTYTNQADTYATMLAITRRDIINDDLSALTAVPRRLGRGGALKLNDIFWTEFLALVSGGFFASGNSNINTGVADMTIGGLAATETIFMNQTDPDGKPLGIMPKIVLVPTALKAAAVALLDAQRGSNVIVTGSDVKIPNANVFNGRFQVESSPYISNSSYTGNTAQAWWMLADPNECSVIEIVALNGRVEPIVETADADFNVLGIQMRGYSDIGVNEQEKRGGVHADGNAS